MDYMLAIYTDDAALATASPEEIASHVTEFAAFVKEMTDRGILKAGAPLQPVATATTVRVRDGEVLTIDGPYAETKEQLAGFFIADCKDLDEAIEVAARIPSALTGAIEVRPVNAELDAAVTKARGA